MTGILIENYFVGDSEVDDNGKLINFGIEFRERNTRENARQLHLNYEIKENKFYKLIKISSKILKINLNTVVKEKGPNKRSTTF